jgi:glycerol-3-phosphate dehydrogenase subunit B
MQTVDVLVLGGGIAGTSAALAAAGTGARTVLLRRGPGVTALAAGGWIGRPPAELAAALAAAGLALHDCDGRLPHPAGSLLSCDAAPASHARAALAGGAERTLVCGIAGLPWFRAGALAALWSEAAALPDGALEPVRLNLDDTPAAGWSPVSLAALLERTPERLGSALLGAVRERGAARVLLPAVLGLDEHRRVHGLLEAAAGVSVGEALGVAPSLPGWRLDRALQRALAAGDVPVFTGTCTEHTRQGERVATVTLAATTGTTVLRTGCVVIATGKFAGGGLVADPRFREEAFGCDIAPERLGRRLDASEALVLTQSPRDAPQPLLTLGLSTDEHGCIVPATGGPALGNAFAAGSVRSGAETALLGLGGAAQDGWEAGLRAAATASGGAARRSWA